MLRQVLIATLAVVSPLARLVAAEETVDAQARAEKAVALIQSSAAKYSQERSCFSCHHQALTAMAAQSAAIAGWTIDTAATRQQSEFTARYFADRKVKLVVGEGVLGGSYTAGYALVGLAADAWPADEVTTALVEYLFRRQQEGRWKIETHRPPLEDSDFTATALAVRGLRLYATDAQRNEADDRTIQASQWLISAEPTSTEDQSMRLLGLAWCRESFMPDKLESLNHAILRSVEQLLSQQREDGGWGQRPDATSDAYATGQAMVALRQAGALAAEHTAMLRGKEWLLTSQLADGSWLVTTRVEPIQEYFESGFPHDESQYISLSGSCWAVMALASGATADKPATTE